MIEGLYIRNVALIDELQLEFSPGLNVLTGETGAGKSVILQSLGLALGERGSLSIVRAEQRTAKVQIAISPSGADSVWTYCTKAGLVDELDAEDALLLARQISAAGRNRCHVNDQLVNLALLQEIGDLIIDIHGQHEHQSLFRAETHLDLVDAFGELEDLRLAVNQKYNEIHGLRHQVSEHSETLREAQREKDFLEFQIDELESAQLEAGEEEELTNERSILSNAESLFESASLVYDQLYGGIQSEFSVLDTLKKASSTTTKLCEIDANLEELNGRLESALYELEDIARQIFNYRDTVEFNPHRLAEIEERLDLIYRLKRKYGDSVADILAYQDEIAKKLKDLEVGSERIEDLKAQINLKVAEAQELALELSEQRKSASTKLESLIEAELHTLGMDKAVFRVLIVPIESPDGLLALNGTHYEFRPNGMDEIEFLISPNVGSEPKPLTKIASGGEISRVMLALKTVLARIDDIPTMVFDEIDAGIGGRTADVVGQKLKELSRVRQVICITHLPQIARFADQHFRVEKRVEGNQTTITAHELTPDERVEEIARMHGGAATEITLAHARELLSE